MKKTALLLLSVPFLLVACSNGDKKSSSPIEGMVLVVDYTNDGGANLPRNWNEGDTEETVRKATYNVEDIEFSMEFVGKWNISENKQEFQTKKNPVSYLRAASDVLVKRIDVEVFEADVGVFLTRDHSGTKLMDTEVEGTSHSDGTLYSYEINSKDWSIQALETYKGDKVNIYSFTFYF